jgi:hypothetical protein
VKVRPSFERDGQGSGAAAQGLPPAATSPHVLSLNPFSLVVPLFRSTPSGTAPKSPPKTFLLATLTSCPTRLFSPTLIFRCATAPSATSLISRHMHRTRRRLPHSIPSQLLASLQPAHVPVGGHRQAQSSGNPSMRRCPPGGAASRCAQEVITSIIAIMGGIAMACKAAAELWKQVRVLFLL